MPLFENRLFVSNGIFVGGESRISLISTGSITPSPIGPYDMLFEDGVQMLFEDGTQMVYEDA